MSSDVPRRLDRWASIMRNCQQAGRYGIDLTVNECIELSLLLNEAANGLCGQQRKIIELQAEIDHEWKKVPL
jgi:hypothetical protein